jgi:Gas vesicle synthesis protein GvpL/GvpF
MLLYAVVPGDAAAPDRQGLIRHRLEIIRSALAAMIVEECPDDFRATKENSHAFAEIICSLTTTAPMLPIRFPTLLATRSAVLAQLQANETTWHHRLIELQGFSEVVIRAQWPEPEPERTDASSTPGTSYLLSRAAALQRRDASVAEISELVREWVSEIKVLPSQQGIRIACLVANDDIPELKEAVLGWQQAGDQRQVVVNGPWPPFSFVADQEAVGA